jgi:heparosan-N-sulfate-glucuronate 5-epimerase
VNDVIAHRLFDERAECLGPYYVTFGVSEGSSELDAGGIVRTDGRRDPESILEFGLEQHSRWKRWGGGRARRLFLAQAQWAVTAQREIAGVPGSYASLSDCREYGCGDGFRSATVQSEAISLLLRAYEDTGHAYFLERAADAAIPLTVDVREGGVLWREGDDLFFEDKAGPVPSHVLSGWICALWGLLELSRTVKAPQIEALYRQSLATLEKYLPCYDTGSWSYESLLASQSGFRRFATIKRHMFHVAQLDVLLSMTKNDLFSVVAERWRRYVASTESRIRLIANTAVALPNRMLCDALTVPGGARSVV